MLGAVRKDLTELCACGVINIANGVSYASFSSGMHK